MFEHKKDIRRIFEGFTDRDFYTVIADFFELSAISLRNSVHIGRTHGEYEERYARTVQKYTPEQFKMFATALGLLMDDIHASMDCGELCDWCGELYMESGTSNSRMGQFFTPYTVSKVTAQAAVREDEVRAKLNGNPDAVFTLYEPTCGAGGLIIAAIEKLMQMRVNYAHNVFVDCGDIDSRCVHMTYLVLSVLGVPAVVRRGDALMLEYTEAWFTPAYVLNCAHFYRQIGDGTYPYTAVAVKSISQPKTAPIVAPKTDAPKNEGGKTAATAQPKTDKHGQYVLELF